MSSEMDFDLKIMVGPQVDFDVVKASGENILTYLQGQITQDIKKLSLEQALYATILNPQGKAVSDFYVLMTQKKGEWAEVMFLCPSAQTTVFIDRLQKFAMGFNLRLGKVSSWQVVSVQGQDTDAYLKSIELPAPTDKTLASCEKDDVFILRKIESTTNGVWVIGLKKEWNFNASHALLEKGRVLRGVPRFGIDWSSSLHPLNANLMERGGVSFDKGCYVGQEVTSRMQWRGGIKKKLYQVGLKGSVALPCAIFTTAKVGEITSLAEDDQGMHYGIALLPIAVVEEGKALQTETNLAVEIMGACRE